jgi:2'-5' RNA ligase
VLRTFIAIDLPAAVREALDRFEKELQSVQAPVAWVKPERVHLTLKFLGDVAPERIPELQGSLARLAGTAAPFPR